MAIEVSPLKEEKPLWQTLLFYFSFVLLILSLILFLTLKYYFIVKFNNERTDTQVQIDKQSQSIYEGRTISSIESEVKAAETKIKDFKTLYQGSLKATKFFQEFEGSIHPKVSFSNLSLTLDSDEPKAVLSGKTESFQTLIQQIEILQKKTNFIKNFDVSNIGMAGGEGVGFALTLNLQPSIFK